MTTTTTTDHDQSSNPSSRGKTSSTGTLASSSQHSSLAAGGAGSAMATMMAAGGAHHRRYNPDAHPPRRTRSQYPRGSSERHVEYILVASFDIDRGPVMEHQYPEAITGDENMLAELMLPDQAHMRNQDWTIFFLHKDTTPEEEHEEARRKESRKRRRMILRQRARGIIDEANEDPEALGDLDDEDNDQADDDPWDDDLSTDSEPEGGEGPPLIYVLNLVNTKQDKTVKRGAIVKAMAICTRHPFLHIYKVCTLPKMSGAGLVEHQFC